MGVISPFVKSPISHHVHVHVHPPASINSTAASSLMFLRIERNHRCSPFFPTSFFYVYAIWLMRNHWFFRCHGCFWKCYWLKLPMDGNVTISNKHKGN